MYSILYALLCVSRRNMSFWNDAPFKFPRIKESAGAVALVTLLRTFGSRNGLTSEVTLYSPRKITSTDNCLDI